MTKFWILYRKRKWGFERITRPTQDEWLSALRSAGGWSVAQTSGPDGLTKPYYTDGSLRFMLIPSTWTAAEAQSFAHIYTHVEMFTFVELELDDDEYVQFFAGINARSIGLPAQVRNNA